jgi:nucleotide-binding universal stress UspA family protein
MEYIPGQDLRTLLTAKTKLSLDFALKLAIQIGEGLQYLHSQGIIHLDIKPENIMVTPDNTAKILDFGLAYKKDFEDLLTEDFVSPHGTPYYIAPEQIEGRRDDIRSDLYSLGMVFYEALTGKLPFPRSDRLSKVKVRLKLDPIPPRYYEKKIPPSIQEIILKALARNPEDRYSSADAMKADISAYEKVPVTDKGMDTDRPSFWRSRFKMRSPLSGVTKGRPGAGPSARKGVPHILGTIVDHETSDLVIETVKRQALISGAHVTLLTVVEDETDSDFTKYQTAVDGERFRKRIDRYLKLLRRYQIDPLVRILEGDVAAVITGLADRIQADLIVLGQTRKKGLKKMFGRSIIDRVIGKAPCNVVVVESDAKDKLYPMPMRTTSSALTEDQLIEIDLYLMDAWVHHVNWLSDLTHALLQNHPFALDLDARHCAFGKWIESIKEHGEWPEIPMLVDEPHRAFHLLAKEMAVQASTGNMNEMKRIYTDDALPQSLKIRESLQKVSTSLREQSALRAAGLSTFFHESTCTTNGKNVQQDTAMTRPDEIRDYFIKHPDATPNDCLEFIRKKRLEENSPERG